MNKLKKISWNLYKYFVFSKYHQVHLESILKNFYYNNGFFIEAGANDGKRQSNTFFLEKHYKWSGILIEPLPNQYNLCKQQCNALTLNFALVPNHYVGNSIKIYDADLMSLIASPHNEKFIKSHLASAKKVQNLESIKTLEVPVIALDQIFELYIGNKKADLLSLDLEGTI